MTRFAIVVTTIAVPTLLLGYADNIERYGRQAEVEFIVIGDRKTPEGARNVTQQLHKRGFCAAYWDIAAQQEWLKPYPALAALIPYDSDNRRNIGYLIAAEHGCEVIISIDDDNYVDGQSPDFLQGHGLVGQTVDVETVTTPNGWFNPCAMLETSPEAVIYPRGFPYACRWHDTPVTRTREQVRVVLNAGLWLGAPDVDAVTRLTLPIRSGALREERLALGWNTWAPVNTQNTAFHRSILPCCYYVLMGSRIDGLTLDRYGDIWFGYLAQTVLHHLGLGITFGLPLVDHRRNTHDLFRDLQQEYWGMVATDALVEVLQEIRLTAATVSDAYLELAHALREGMAAQRSLPLDLRRHFTLVCDAMEAWVAVCVQIL